MTENYKYTPRSRTIVQNDVKPRSRCIDLSVQNDSKQLSRRVGANVGIDLEPPLQHRCVNVQNGVRLWFKRFLSIVLNDTKLPRMCNRANVQSNEKLLWLRNCAILLDDAKLSSIFYCSNASLGALAQILKTSINNHHRALMQISEKTVNYGFSACRWELKMMLNSRHGFVERMSTTR